jgi:hypothetical protein
VAPTGDLFIRRITMPDLVGEKLGRYEVRARVAGSAVAEVYGAYSPTLGREVALKVYRPHLAGHRSHIAIVDRRDVRMA